MSSAIAERASAWIYRGVWSVLVGLFRVPHEPPTLPLRPGEVATGIRPAPGFLAYRTFIFWCLLIWPDIALLIGWAVIYANHPRVGVWLAAPFLFIAIVPDVIAYVAVHLRYDTTWYILTDRSLRISRGVWIVQETTITYENIQNVTVTQGPLQRYFKIADVTVETAGGGGAAAGGGAHGAGHSMHVGVLEGLSDAHAVRELIMSKVRASRAAGLGDDAPPAPELPGPSASPGARMWGPRHLDALRELAQALRA